MSVLCLSRSTLTRICFPSSEVTRKWSTQLTVSLYGVSKFVEVDVLEVRRLIWCGFSWLNVYHFEFQIAESRTSRYK